MSEKQGCRVFLRQRKHGQNDGERILGTIVDTKLDAHGNSFKVIWDNGCIERYNRGSTERNEIIPIETTHHGVMWSKSCDECQNLVSGLIWNCIQCHNVNVCTSCYMADYHDISHVFKRFMGNYTEWKILPARNVSKKVRLVGLFPGATVMPNEMKGNDMQNHIGSSGILTSYKQSNNFKFSSICVVWHHSTTQSVYFLGKDDKVDVKCLIPGAGPFYYEHHLPSLDSPVLNTDTIKRRSTSVQLTNSYACSVSHFCQKSLQSYQNEFLPVNKINEQGGRKSRSWEQLNVKGESCHNGEENNLQMVKREETLLKEIESINMSDGMKADEPSKMVHRGSTCNMSRSQKEIQIKMSNESPSLKILNEISPSDCNAMANWHHRIKYNDEKNSNIFFVFHEDTKCCLCKKRTVDVIFEPCQHSIVCQKCAYYFKRCYICQGNILEHWTKQLDKHWNQRKRNTTDDERSANAAVDPRNEMVQELVGRMDILTNRLTRAESCFICSICQINKKNVSFQCGHSTCDICSENIRKCVVCHATIEVKTFYDQNAI